MSITLYHDIFQCHHHRYKFVTEIEDLYMDPSCRRGFNSGFDPDDMVGFSLIAFTHFQVVIYIVF